MSEPTESDWSVLEWLEMAENRLECALMGDEVCKGCVDVALSYVKEAMARVRADERTSGVAKQPQEEVGSGP